MRRIKEKYTMKYIKMLGLAAIAAAALAALLGAGTASATVLCEVTPAPNTHCGATNHVKSGTELDFSLESGTSTLLKGPFGETIATCTESTVKDKTTTTGSTTETVKGEVKALSFTSCNRPVTVVSGGSLEVHHESGFDNGTVTSSGATIEIHNVPLLGTCKYTTNATDIGTLTGKSPAGGPPTFHIGATITSENGCPTGAWSGKYVYTGSTPFDVVAG